MCTRCREHLFLHKRHFREVPEAVRVANEAAGRRVANEAAGRRVGERRSGRESKMPGVCKTAPVYPVDCNGCSHDDPDSWQESDARRYYLDEGRLSNNCYNCGWPV